MITKWRKFVNFSVGGELIEISGIYTEDVLIKVSLPSTLVLQRFYSNFLL